MARLGDRTACLRRTLAAVVVAIAMVPATGVVAQPAPTPEAAAPDLARYAAFAPMIGRTWQGSATDQDGVEDVQRWDWAVGGHAVRIVHSVNGGAYAGETLVYHDRDSDGFIFHYFTTGGFHTTGVIRASAPGAFDIDETVHGAAGIERLRSTGVLGADGVYRVRSSMERDGDWVEVGGFDHREAPAAVVRMPAAPSEPVSASPPAWWPAHVDFMTRGGGGAWETPNPGAASDPEAPEAYGMQWTRVNDGAGLTGRLYGVRDGQETGEFWTFREFYYPGRGVVVIEQWGGPGVYGVGETTAPGPDRGETDQTFWLPDGRSWREGHRTVEDGDIYHTDVFDIDADGIWMRRDGNVWQRVVDQVAPPS